MPLTEAQIDNWFDWHPPTHDQADRYMDIRDAESSCPALADRYMDIRDAESSCHALAQRIGGGEMVHPDVIRQTFKAFAWAIEKAAPDSADKTASIRCVRLASGLANEAVYLRTVAPTYQNLIPGWITQQILLARIQASAAIACGGK